MKRQSFKLSDGEKMQRSPNNVVLTVVPDGQRTYIWIGNDAKDDKMCFATLSGAAQLRSLAEAILAAIDVRPARSRSKKQKIEDELRRSDLTAQLAGRDNIEYGPHDSLPRGEHVARRRSGDVS